MRRWIALLLFFSLLITPCALAEGVHVVGDNAGEVYCPEGSDAQTAQYVYRYQYPLLENTGETAQMINDFYDYLISDAKDFMIPMTYETLEVSPVQAYTAITSQVMCNNEDYFSVLVTTESFMGAETSQILAGHTFALQGGKAGTCISLPYLLGLLEADENDTWMQDRATAKANELVYGLVWSIIEEQKAEGIIAYYDDLTREELEAQFYPEEDFYLDENGNPVEYQSLYSNENRVWVDYSQIPQAMKDAIVAIEDKRFWEHNGVDWRRTLGAGTPP